MLLYRTIKRLYIGINNSNVLIHKPGGSYLVSQIEVLLEQYKLYVEMADRVSDRRGQANKFYISLLSGLLTLVLLTQEKGLFSQHQTILLVAVALLGIALCALWHINIRSYRQLNTAKFKIIHEFEQQLPLAMYDREWEVLGRGADSKKYLQLTRVEQLVPFVFAIPYLLLLIAAIFPGAL